MQRCVLASFLLVALAIQQASAATIYRAGNASKAYPKVRTPQDYNDPDDEGLIKADSKKGVSRQWLITTCDGQLTVSSRMSIYNRHRPTACDLLSQGDARRTAGPLILASSSTISKLSMIMTIIGPSHWSRIPTSTLSSPTSTALGGSKKRTPEPYYGERWRHFVNHGRRSGRSFQSLLYFWCPT